MTEIIQSLIPPTAAKIEIVSCSKSGNFPAASCGFFSYIGKLDDYFQNIVSAYTIMIRKGKTGKERLNQAEIAIPVFFFEHENFNKIMPTDDKRNYVRISTSKQFSTSQIMYAEPLDFIGWAVAVNMRLTNMNGMAKHGMWPEDQSHPLNVLNRMVEHFEERAGEYIEKFSNPVFRERVVMELRAKDSSMAKIAYDQMVRKASFEAHAAKFLVFTNEGQFIPSESEDKSNEFRFTEDSALLQKTHEFYKKKHDELRKLRGL